VVEDNTHITDEAEAIERLGHSIKIVSNSKSNIKITHSDDLKLANYYLNKP
jgi:2-C-methyl-D-erythritol 4-phosphate cytidylyltransferase